MDQAMKKHIEANRVAIMLLIESMGPQSLGACIRECAIQTNGDRLTTCSALEELVAQGALVIDTEDGNMVYDLPCQPWPSAA